MSDLIIPNERVLSLLASAREEAGEVLSMLMHAEGFACGGVTASTVVYTRNGRAFHAVIHDVTDQYSEVDRARSSHVTPPIDPVTAKIIEATRRRFAACAHAEIVEPPPGKTLRVCLECGCRLIECDRCDAKTFSRPGIGDSGWTTLGSGSSFTNDLSITSLCPGCSR